MFTQTFALYLYMNRNAYFLFYLFFFSLSFWFWLLCPIKNILIAIFLVFISMCMYVCILYIHTYINLLHVYIYQCVFNRNSYKILKSKWNFLFKMPLNYFSFLVFFLLLTVLSWKCFYIVKKGLLPKGITIMNFYWNENKYKFV